jgi:hypothetical protein
MDLRHLNRWLVLALAASALAGPAAGQTQTFPNPTQDGFPLDYCMAGGGVCGEDVAMSWCRAQGYEYASEWAAVAGSDVGSATIRLDDGAICRGAQCDAFGSITCGKEGRTYRMPTLGAAARATVIAPNRAQAVAEVAPTDYKVLIPGCHEREPGMYLCETDYEYQHCRTLMKSGKVYGCRAGLAFADGFAKPIAAASDAYSLELRSSAAVTVEKGQRGEGKIKGDVRFEVSFALPKLDASVWCLQRERYLYHPTGPKGGIADIDDTQDCDVPITGSFAPHEDDLLQAYDLCDSFAAWGSELEQPIELLVAALYQVGSASPTFRSEHGASTVVAPYTTIRAPMKISCKD